MREWFPAGSTTKAQRKRAHLRYRVMSLITTDRLRAGRPVDRLLNRMPVTLAEMHSPK